MSILTAKFSSSDNDSVIVTYDDGRPTSSIPVAVGNRDYAEVQTFGTPDAFTPPVPTTAQQVAIDLRAANVTPATVAAAQYLDGRGDSSLLDDIDNAVDAIVVSSGLDLEDIAALIA